MDIGDFEYDGDLKVDLEKYRQIHNCDLKIKYLKDMAQNLSIKFSDDTIKKFVSTLDNDLRLIIDDIRQSEFLEEINKTKKKLETNAANELESKNPTIELSYHLRDYLFYLYKVSNLLIEVYNNEMFSKLLPFFTRDTINNKFTNLYQGIGECYNFISELYRDHYDYYIMTTTLRDTTDTANNSFDNLMLDV